MSNLYLFNDTFNQAIIDWFNGIVLDKNIDFYSNLAVEQNVGFVVTPYPLNYNNLFK